MSHVDEGLLHAYVDGAFASGDAHGIEIEAHLASCADCRARLEDARALKDRAHEVLHHATPADVHIPPFDALRARKQSGSHGGVPARGAAEASTAARRLARAQVRLAWAASVVLAVGAGWMANELFRRDAAESAATQDGAVRVSAPEAEAHEGQASASAESAGVDTRAGSADADAQPRSSMMTPGEPQAPAAPLDAVRAEAEPRAERSRVQADAAPRARVDSPPAPGVVAVAPTTPANQPTPLARDAEKLPNRALQRPNSEVRLEEIVIDTADTPTVDTADTMDRRMRRAAGELTRTTFRPSDVIALDTMPPALADGRAFDGHVALLNDYTDAVGGGLWSPATTAQAAAALGHEPVGIMNLPPIGTETAVVNGRVLVRQRYLFVGGVQVELIQRPALAALTRADRAAFRERWTALPSAGVPLKDLGESSPTFRGESLVAASRPGLVLLLKGSVSQDWLRGVAARLR